MTYLYLVILSAERLCERQVITSDVSQSQRHRHTHNTIGAGVYEVVRHLVTTNNNKTSVSSQYHVFLSVC